MISFFFAKPTVLSFLRSSRLRFRVCNMTNCIVQNHIDTPQRHLSVLIVRYSCVAKLLRCSNENPRTSPTYPTNTHLLCFHFKISRSHNPFTNKMNIDCFACGVQQHVETTTVTADCFTDFTETNERPDAEAGVDAESTTLFDKDPTDSEKNESSEVEKAKRKSYLPSISSRGCSTAQDIAIDEARDDVTIVTERCDATVVSQATSTKGGRNDVEVNYIADNAVKTDERKGEREGAEKDALGVLIYKWTAESTSNEALISPETLSDSNTNRIIRRRLGKLRSMTAIVKKGSLYPTAKKGAISEGEALETKKSANDEEASPANEETFTAAEDQTIVIPETAAEDEKYIKPERQSAVNSHLNKLRSMPESLASTVKKGSLAATEKKGALINAMHAKMAKNHVVMKGEKEAITKAKFVDMMNAKVKKTMMAEEGRKPESDRASEMKAVLVQSAWSYDFFQVVLSGNKSTDMMIRLPYKQNTTFQDLRRELEEDYAEDLPYSRFKFTVTENGMAVSSVQEQKWTVRDYDLTNQGGDGSFKNPYLVYIKKDIGEESGKKKAWKTKKGTGATLWSM